MKWTTCQFSWIYVHLYRIFREHFLSKLKRIVRGRSKSTKKSSFNQEIEKTLRYNYDNKLLCLQLPTKQLLTASDTQPPRTRKKK